MNTLDIFPWNENFNTGVEKIDQQHQMLVQLLNQLAGHMASQVGAEVLNNIFDQLAEYTVYHFQTEESIWHEYLADELLETEHKKKHAGFISTVIKLKVEVNTQPSEKMVEKILSFLTRWLASHILETDLQMAKIVQAMQSGMPLEAAKIHAQEQMSGTMKVLIDIILSTYGKHVCNTLYMMKEVNEHRLVELSEYKLSRARALLSKCSSLLIHAQDEQSLLGAICKLVVETGDYQMAWVGVAEEDAGKRVRPIVHYGHAGSYLEDVNINWDDTERGQGPTGMAIRTGKVSFRDIQNDSCTYLWRDAAIKMGYRASIALPLANQQGVWGVLTIYAKEISILSSGEVDLMAELANDLSFGIESLRMRVENEAAKISLKIESDKNIALLRNASDGIHIIDSDGNVLEASNSFCAMLGYTREEIIGANISQLDAKFSGNELTTIIAQQFLSTERVQFETRHKRKDGSIFDVEVSGVTHYFNDKPVLFNSSRDITQRKIIDAELRVAATAFESHEGMLITDSSGKIVRANQAFSDITGYPLEEVIGKNPSIFQSGRQDKYFYEAMWEEINSQGSWQGEIWNRRKSGEIYPQYLSITAVKDSEGNTSNYVATLTDITLSKAADDEIRNLAFYDPLTQLPNRRLLFDRLKQALASSSRTGLSGSLLFIDLDNFKTLNDTLGHDIGDLLLQQVGDRLKSCVREEDTVARLGGDEFVVMLENLSKNALIAAEQIEATGNKILLALNQPYQLAAYKCHSTPSIGATQFNNHQLAIDELLKQGDIAMYQAKKAGRNKLRFFNQKMQESINARAELEHELRAALENNHFELYYQIQVDSHNLPIGAEALVRWIHPERGLISPIKFIPLAEETELILPLGSWVLEAACIQIKRWGQRDLTKALVMAVNVSARQFRQPDFVGQIKDLLVRYDINPRLLKLELTESLLLDNVEKMITKMHILKKIGIQFSLDDFGTGYSSLQYLKRLPLDQLKIDQSFVRNLVTDMSDRAIVRTIITMAETLQLNVIAEGVETDEQRQLLINKNCTCFQGYLFGKPVPIKQLDEMLMHGFGTPGPLKIL